MIDEIYQVTHDIDWFCVVDGCPIHVASNGLPIPRFIKNLQELAEWQGYVAMLPERMPGEVWDSPQLEDTIRKGYENFEEGREKYVETFRKFASKGFYSFDTILVDGRVMCQLVARPWGRFENDEQKLLELESKNREYMYIDDVINKGYIPLVDIINQCSRKI